MAATKKPNPILILADRMTRVLVDQGRLRAGQPPLKLSQLGRQADPAATDDVILKAVGKTPFKERVLVALPKRIDSPVALAEDAEALAASDELLLQVAELVCTAESPAVVADKFVKKVAKPLQPPFAAALERRANSNQFPPALGLVAVKKKTAIHLRRHPLPKPAEVQLAEQLVAALKSQRSQDAASYPTTLRRLAELSQASDALLTKALKQPAFADAVLVAMKGPDSPVALREDRDRLLASMQLLEAALRAARSIESQVASPAELAKKVLAPLKDAFAAAIEQALATRALPASVGWLRQKKNALLFFRDDVQPRSAPREVAAPPSSAIDFVRHFDEAFQRLDRAAGSHNFVSLVDLRRAMPVGRQVFDDELRRLRLAGRYTLTVAEGRHGLSPAEQEAGILEHGNLLLFVARKAT